MQPVRTAPGPLSINALTRRIGGSLLLNAVCPWAAYQLLTARDISSVAALAITAIFPIVGTLVGWVRLGRPDVLGVLSVLFIGLSLAVALATDNALVILLRRSVANAAFAMLCFGSLAFTRPLMFYVARQYVAGWNRTAFASFDAQWEQPRFRLTMRRITVAWGCWFAAQAAGRVVAVELMDVPTFLAIWPVITNIGTFAMILGSVNYAQRGAGRRAWDPAEHGARLSEAARHALDRADKEAKRFRHGYIGTEHLLVALSDDESGAARALHNVSVTPGTARSTLEAVVGYGNAPAWQELAYAARVNSALGRAFDAHRAARASEIGTDHLLIGLLDEPGGQAVHLLTYMGVDLPRLRAQLAGDRDVPPPAETR